jgi:hypothetical protein
MLDDDDSKSHLKKWLFEFNRVVKYAQSIIRDPKLKAAYAKKLGLI